MALVQAGVATASGYAAASNITRINPATLVVGAFVMSGDIGVYTSTYTSTYLPGAIVSAARV